MCWEFTRVKTLEKKIVLGSVSRICDWKVKKLNLNFILGGSVAFATDREILIFLVAVSFHQSHLRLASQKLNLKAIFRKIVNRIDEYNTITCFQYGRIGTKDTV